MHRFFITVLRAGIATAILFGLFGQLVIIPTTAADEVDRFPPYAPYALPYTLVAIAGVACVQVVLAAAWRLLTMVERDAIFSSAAFRWLDVIIGSTIAATLLALAVTCHLMLADIPSPEDGMELIGALGAATAATGMGTCLVMLIVIMRGLLLKANNMKSELAEVV
ncbi:DUF2975 domain-containing protein [Streptomyces sp. NPDC058525]|uniref:DUF2975 domain-containing protein n=1 Tax=Streptomyces sp. NPDC058525 TaxID=3346538 RepID=UPI0036607855